MQSKNCKFKIQFIDYEKKQENSKIKDKSIIESKKPVKPLKRSLSKLNSNQNSTIPTKLENKSSIKNQISNISKNSNTHKNTPNQPQISSTIGKKRDHFICKFS